MSCANDGNRTINLPKNPEEAGYEWRGDGPKGVKEGSWYNSKTGEKIYPDREHKPPIGPHDDYTDSSGKVWRVKPDGGATPK